MPKNKPVRDIGASVRARLLKVAQKRGYTFDLILTRYALERFLYRLSISPHKDRFVLKGAMLVTTWFDDPHRPTRDLDLLGVGDPSQDGMLSIFRRVCNIKCEDGIMFDAAALRVDVIREELKYGGLRLRTEANLAAARIAIVVDIGFGDSTEPGAEKINLPVLLDFPAPELRAYARDRHCRKISCNGRPRARQQSDEGLLRRLASRKNTRICGRQTPKSDRRHIP